MHTRVETELAEQLADAFEIYLRERLQIHEPVGWSRIEEFDGARQKLIARLLSIIQILREGRQ